MHRRGPFVGVPGLIPGEAPHHCRPSSGYRKGGRRTRPPGIGQRTGVVGSDGFLRANAVRLISSLRAVNGTTYPMGHDYAGALFPCWVMPAAENCSIAGTELDILTRKNHLFGRRFDRLSGSTKCADKHKLNLSKKLGGFHNLRVAHLEAPGGC
jgi:hypothetical protein